MTVDPGGGVTMIVEPGPGGAEPGTIGAGRTEVPTVNWSMTWITPTVSAVSISALALAASSGTIPLRVAIPPAWTSSSMFELVRPCPSAVGCRPGR